MKYVGKQLVLYIYTYHILYLLSKYFCIYYAHLYLYFIAGNSSFKNQLKTRTLLEVSRKTVVRVWSEKNTHTFLLYWANYLHIVSMQIERTAPGIVQTRVEWEGLDSPRFLLNWIRRFANLPQTSSYFLHSYNYPKNGIIFLE